jgi:hypothetical protein
VISLFFKFKCLQLSPWYHYLSDNVTVDSDYDEWSCVFGVVGLPTAARLLSYRDIISFELRTFMNAGEM